MHGVEGGSRTPEGREDDVLIATMSLHERLPSVAAHAHRSRLAIG